MADIKTIKQAHAQAVLLYFNRILLEKGVITKKEYMAMSQ